MRVVKLSEYLEADPAPAAADPRATPPTEQELRECIVACKTALDKVEKWTANLHVNLAHAVDLAERQTGWGFQTESGGTDKPPPDTP